MNLGCKNKRIARTERIGSYLVCDSISITLAIIVRAVDRSVQGNLAAIFSLGLMKRFGESTIHMFIELFRKMTTKNGANDSDSRLRMIFVRYW